MLSSKCCLGATTGNKINERNIAAKDLACEVTQEIYTDNEAGDLEDACMNLDVIQQHLYDFIYTFQSLCAI